MHSGVPNRSLFNLPFSTPTPFFGISIPDNEKLFDKALVEEDEDFEIPAFLRKQKF